jgi:hypothetical protein
MRRIVASFLPIYFLAGEVGARRYRRQLARHLRFEKWPKNLLRHTAASYWLADWQDAGKAARELGNNCIALPEIILT